MPRIPELEAALTALGANENERMLAWSLLNVPRGMQQARKETTESHSTIWADVGDLLRAMRMRGGMTQEQMAAELGLQRSAVRRWEMGECLPSLNNMERVFLLLNALPEERHILRDGTDTDARTQKQPDATSARQRPHVCCRRAPGFNRRWWTCRRWP